MRSPYILKLTMKVRIVYIKMCKHILEGYILLQTVFHFFLSFFFSFLG